MARTIEYVLHFVRFVTVTVDRHALGMEQVSSSSPGCVRYISLVHRAYIRLLGSLLGSLGTNGSIQLIVFKKIMK